MIVFQAQNISKSFGSHEVLRGIGIALQEKERLGLVGVNGSGKSTLLKCLTGELEPDSGEITLATGMRLGYMAQLDSLAMGHSAWDNVMQAYAELLSWRRRMAELEAAMGDATGQLELDSLLQEYAELTGRYELANGYACESNARRILLGLGFAEHEFDKSADQFSGGQRTRLSLAKLLARSPDILLLDEPSNDLDIASMEWLEEFLSDYPGSLIMVSHDRRLLDRVCTRVAEIRQTQIRSYAGNYSNYLRKRELVDEADRRAYEKQQEEIRMTEEFIRRYKAGIKSKQARGRQSQLDRLERLTAPDQERELHLKSFQPRRESGEIVIRAGELVKSYGDQVLFNDIGLEIRRGERIGIVGPNGSGKTTLLKILLRHLNPDQGWVEHGSSLDIAYFHQGFEGLSGEQTVLDDLLEQSRLTIGEARNLLGTMLFQGDEVFQSLNSLSGGQRARLKLLYLLLEGANCLVLDEPTNHLDMESCQAVEELLLQYRGTLIVVSHDRWFMDRLVNRVLALQAGQLLSYPGNYSYYQEKIAARLEEQRRPKERSANPLRQQQEAQKRAEREERQLRQALMRCEEAVHTAEMQLKELEQMLSDPRYYGDDVQLRLYGEEYQQRQSELEQLLERWAEAESALQQWQDG